MPDRRALSSGSWLRWLCAITLTLLAGCAASPTPLPDLNSKLPTVLTPKEQKEALDDLERRKNVANEATRQIEAERVK